MNILPPPNFGKEHKGLTTTTEDRVKSSEDIISSLEDRLQDILSWQRDLYNFLKHPSFPLVRFKPTTEPNNITEGDTYYDEDLDALITYDGGVDESQDTSQSASPTFAGLTLTEQLVLTGDGRVYKYMDIPLSAWKKDASNPPADGLEGGFPTLDFDDSTDESIKYLFKVPPDWEDGTDISLLLDFFVDTVDTVTERSIRWRVEFIKMGTDDQFAFTGISSTDLFDIPITTANKEILTSSSITMRDWVAGRASLLMRLYRDANHASDDHTGDARLFSTTLKYTSNKLGESV